MYFFVRLCIVDDFRKRRKAWFLIKFSQNRELVQNLGKEGFYKVFRINAQIGPIFRIKRIEWVFAFFLLLSGYKGEKRVFSRVFRQKWRVG